MVSHCKLSDDLLCDSTNENHSTSPSVYVAYRGLQASAAYLPFGQNLGGGTHDVTVGYPPDILSTSHCNIQYKSASAVQSWARVNYTALQYPLPNSLVTDCPRATGEPNVGGAVYDPAAFNEMGNPFFSVPGNLTWVDPAWSTCIPVSYGIYDPPRKLDKVSAPMVAPTPVAKPTSPIADAAPAASVAPPLPPATSAPAADPNQPVSQPVVKTPAVNTAVAQNQGTNNPAAVTPGSTPDTTSIDPNNESGAQMSALHQALAPAPAASPQVKSAAPQPVAQPAESVVQQNDGQVNAVKPAANQPAAAQPAAQPAQSVVGQNNGQVNAQVSANTGPGISGNSPVVAPATNQNAAVANSNTNPPAAVAPGIPQANSGNTPAQGAPGQNSPQTKAAANPVVMAAPTPFVIAGNIVAPAPNGGIVLASSTYAPGSQATIAGKVYSVGSSVIQDANSRTFSIQPTPTPVLVAGNSVAKAAGGGVVIASSTYTPGAQAQVAGTSFSVGADNIAVAGSTHALPASPSQTPVLVGGQSVARASNGGVIVGSSTIAPGEQATVANHVISAGPSNVVVDSSSFALPTSAGAILQQASAQQQAAIQQQAPAQQPTPVLVGGQSIVKVSNGGVVIGSSTLAPGAQTTVQGHVVSADPSNVVVDGSSSYALPTSAGAVLQQAPEQQQTPVLFGGQSIARASNGGVVVGSSTLALGAQATIQGHVVSAGPANEAGPANVIVDGSTLALPSSAGAVLQTPLPQQAPVLVGGQSIARASNGGIVIGSSTLAPGSQATISGYMVSAGAGSSGNVVIDGSTQALPTSAGAVLQTPAPQQQQVPFLVGGQSIARASNGAILIGSSTLAPGAHTTVAGHTISAAPNNANLIIDGTTQTLPTNAGALLQTVAPQQSQSPLLIGGQSIARASNGAILIGSSTLAPGSTTTVDGHTISAAPNNANVVVDGATQTLATSAGAVLHTPTPEQAPVLIGGQSVTRASDGGIIIGTSTLPPGTQATMAGHTISANTNSDNIILDGINYALPTTPGAILQTAAATSSSPIPTPTPEPVVTLANGALISAGGAAATISGLLASVLPNDSGIVIGSTTYPMPSPSSTAAPSSIFTVGGQVFTAAPKGFVIAPGETVMPGGSAVTLGGTVVSLDQTGDLQIGSSTLPLVPSPTDGGYAAGIAYPSANGSSPTQPYTAGSSKAIRESCVLTVIATAWLVLGVMMMVEL